MNAIWVGAALAVRGVTSEAVHGEMLILLGLSRDRSRRGKADLAGQGRHDVGGAADERAIGSIDGCDSLWGVIRVDGLIRQREEDGIPA